MIALIYACVTMIATFIGGWLFFQKPFNKIELRYLVAFAAGAMTGIAFFDLIPEAAEYRGALPFVAVGFFTLYLIEKLIMIHACGEHECEEHNMVGPVAMVGIIGESLADGIAIAAGFAINEALGVGIAVAILIHEIPRGFSTAVIMKAAKASRKRMFFSLAADGGFTVIGALIGLFLAPGLFPYIIAFTAGTFIYIGASDLLPEAHRRFNVKVVMAVFVGALMMFGVSLFTHGAF